MKRLLPLRHRAGFTLAEVMVSSALIVAIMGLMLSTIDQTRRTINGTTSRVSQFQAARTAFEAMTRNLSQATLNTYWDLDREPDTKAPIRYRRNSDLHFISGRAGGSTEKTKIFNGLDEAIYPGHAIFFQAPIGFTAAEKTSGTASTPPLRYYKSLSNLLSVIGYYVKWDKDTTLPNFIQDNERLKSDRYRYRLMEVVQPGETAMIYNNINYTTFDARGTKKAPQPSPYRNPTDWISVATGRLDLPTAIAAFVPGGAKRVDYSRSLAENIVSLIILPKYAERDRKTPDALDDLTADFEYDSRPFAAMKSQARETLTGTDLVASLRSVDKRLADQVHQLPPILQVTMIAIDDDSAKNLEAWAVDNGNTPPDWTRGMFKSVSNQAAFQKELGDPSKLDSTSLIYKIANPDRTLPTPKLNYRVFTTDVVMRGAKWSKDQPELQNP